jgi:hypothetical protein
VPGFAPRSRRVGDPQRSPPPAVQARAARAARRRGPLRAPHAGRVGRTPLATGAVPPAAGPRPRVRSPAPRSAPPPVSPFGPPTLQHLSAALRRHARAETVSLGAPTSVRLERPLHDFLLVRAMGTARPSYRCAHDAVKRSRMRSGGEARLPPRRTPCYGVPLGTGERGRAHGVAAHATAPGPPRPLSVSGDDSRAPGVIHRRG